MKKTANASDTYCNVKEQKNLVSKMTDCDSTKNSHSDKVECYVKVTKESRENKACMYS